MDLENYIEKRVIGGKDKKEVTVVVKPLSSIEESRKMYPYRPIVNMLNRVLEEMNFVMILHSFLITLQRDVVCVVLQL